MWDIAWYYAAVLSAIICMFGGIAHIVIPPIDTDKISMARRLFAAFVVGFVLFFIGLDPRNMTFPSGEAFAWATGLVATGYFAIEILGKWTNVPPVAPVVSADEPVSVKKAKK